MNAIDTIKQGVIFDFARRCAKFGSGLAETGIKLFVNPTEELDYATKSGKAIKAYMRSNNGGARARLEQNYLFDTRRFASGALAAQDATFFQSSQGTSGQNNGFPAALNMSELETNMDTPGQIATGKNFVFNQLGISFNVDASTVDVGLLLEAGALRFEKQGGQYTLKHGPISFWPGGVGIAGYAATTVAATTLQSAHNGSADIRAARKLDIPRIIKEKESFAYKFIVPRAVRNLDNSTAITLGANVIMRIWLWGGQQDNIPV